MAKKKEVKKYAYRTTFTYLNKKYDVKADTIS